MAQFREAFYRTNAVEGIYSNDKNDSGGETVFGISRNNWPKEPLWAVVDLKRTEPGFPKNLDCEVVIDMAEQFYKKNFWDRFLLDEVKSQAVANEIYDTGINIGTTILRFCVLALNSLNKQQSLYSDLSFENAETKAVIERLNIVTDHKNGVQVLVKALNSIQGVYYMVGKNGFRSLVEALIKDPPTQTREDFMWGWMINRVFEAKLENLSSK